MLARSMQKGTLITRDAHSALLELKSLVDLAVENAHRAELETVGLAVSVHPLADPLPTLRIAADTLQSPAFQTRMSEARAKIEEAVAWHVSAKRAQP